MTEAHEVNLVSVMACCTAFHDRFAAYVVGQTLPVDGGLVLA